MLRHVGSNCTAVRHSIDVRVFTRCTIIRSVLQRPLRTTFPAARCPQVAHSDLVSNPSLRKDRPATNRLSHCTAVILRDGLGLKHGYKTRELFHLQMRYVTPTYRPQAVSVSVVVLGEGDA
jgi:hypothetical protein